MALLAHRGHTVIASIHQPRPAIFERFQKVVVLSEGHQVETSPSRYQLSSLHGSRLSALLGRALPFDANAESSLAVRMIYVKRAARYFEH